MKDIQSPAEGFCSQMQSGSAPIDQRQELNNMLAQLARRGNEAALAQLWEINRPVLHTMFWRWYDRNRSIADAAGLTLEDFEQEGFFAVKRAAEYHDPEKGAFLTALQYSVKHQIREATIGGHGRCMTTEEGKTVRLPADPLSSASSLDEQLPSDDDDRTIADMVADPAAVQEFESLEKSLYLETLRPVLDKALAMLPEQQREVVRGRFFEKLTLKQAGECVGVSASRAAQLEYYGLRAMRRNASLRRFYGEDLLSRAYRGTGFGAWAHRGSVEERLVERQEEKERRLAAANTKHLAELLDLDVAELCGLLDE
ncbi:MAG TPA: sigma-70 family RNA polymerase sigma factor [Candidatus Fournierella merdipullorum]|uniref:Sigma-70 family RNA polymerase sigma factor n=1 Tax=Candidatus Allofournierella merdipullorum TaxID=2838595 RepID=A0A9D2IYD5_9FIRM|nr:sigma-70 family RNA polymerase sigma factor [Candidatus Fournierella merdipullorum]